MIGLGLKHREKAVGFSFRTLSPCEMDDYLPVTYCVPRAEDCAPGGPLLSSVVITFIIITVTKVSFVVGVLTTG